jgi:hypothetical protein
MRWTARTFPLWLALPLLASGCQPINFDQTYTIPAGGVQSAAFGPPRYAQKIKVTITPSDGPVTAYVVKDPDQKFGDTPPVNKPTADLVLASKDPTKTEEYTLETTIPAKTPYAVLLYATKRTGVKVKITGR